MHGSVHDFVVSQTIPNAEELPSGHGGGKVIDILGEAVRYCNERKAYLRVLDIGSLDICGSMRNYDFCGKGHLWLNMIRCDEYIGIDLMDGPGVDEVMDAHALTFPDQSFDLVLCLSMLEHDRDPAQTIREAHRVLKKDGMFLLSTHDKTHPEHAQLGGAVTDHYNFFEPEDIEQWFDEAGLIPIMYHIESDIFVEATRL